MNQRYLVEAISKECGYSKEAVKEVVYAFCDVVTRSLASGEDVMITNFGTFSAVERGGGKRRNPQTGDTFYIDPYRAAKFTVSSRLAEVVRGGLTEFDGLPVTVRKIPKGGVGVIPVIVTDPSTARAKVKNRSIPRKRARSKA